MYRSINEKISNISVKKANYLESGIMKYMVASILAGIYIGIGVILTSVITSTFTNTGFQGSNLINGLSFGISLTFVVLIGGELFTGNNLVMAVGYYNKRVKINSVLKILFFSFLGNFLGSILLGILFNLSGAITPTLESVIMEINLNKINQPFNHLLIKGVFCNLLVCSALIGAYKTESDIAKILIIFCSIYPFVTIGFEHCVANMTCFTIGFIKNGFNINLLLGMMKNLLSVTIGNIIGGSLVLGGMLYIMGNEN